MMSGNSVLRVWSVALFRDPSDDEKSCARYWLGVGPSPTLGVTYNRENFFYT